MLVRRSVLELLVLEVGGERGARAARGCTEAPGEEKLFCRGPGTTLYSSPDLLITRGGTVGVLSGTEGVGTGGGVAGAGGCAGADRGVRDGVMTDIC